VQGRSQTRVLARGAGNVTLIDDSYNANPDSVRAAIDVLAALPGPRWLVLGDMGEVGARGAEFHAEVGGYAQQRGIDAFWSVGPLCAHAAAAFAGARHFSDVAGLIAALREAPECAAILVKGSRFMKMEQVVSALLSETGAAHAA
jgi:UDP-N-acetylmuramoyl-tripeptide--D-alanyl-D-alanine ligase